MSPVFSLPVLVTGSALLIAGCGAKEEPAKTAAPASETTEAAPTSSKADDAFADLSAEDRELALAQKVCPVSGEALGSMGAPIKVTVDGKSLFICCDGCEKAAKDKFAEYYAKVSPEAKDAEGKDEATN